MKFYAGLFLIGAVLNIVLGWHAWPGVFAGNLNDPDSYMRLLRIEQGIHLGHLTNMVSRDGGGAGVMVEWSRLLDMVLWLMAAPLAIILGWHKALFIAGVATGPLSVGLLGAALAFAARPFAEDGLLWSAPVAAAVLPGLLVFATPGTVHYHILLAALIALSVGFVIRAWRGETWFGFMAGIFGGLAIWLTPETMPFILLGFAPLLYRWTQRPFGAVAACCGAGLFDMIGFAVAIDPPRGGYAVAQIDRLSVVYAALGFAVMLGAGILWRLERWPNGWRRNAAGIGAMAGLIALWIAAFPNVVLGPYGLMSPADMQRFFGAMTEMMPLHGISQLVQFLLPGLLALLYAVWRGVRPGGSWLWLYLAFCILLSMVLADMFTLFVEFPALVAAGLVPVLLSAASQLYRRRPAAQGAARIFVIAAMLLLPSLPALAGLRMAAHPGGPSCSLRHINNLLGGDGNSIVLAEADATPELLYRTKVQAVGSLFQHGVPAYLMARDAWRSIPGSVEPDAVAATGARLVLFCPEPQRSVLVSDLPATTLWDVLQAGQPPRWLTLRNQDPSTGWQVFVIQH